MDLNNPAHPGHANYLISTNGLRAVPVDFTDEPLFESTRNELLDQLHDFNTEQCGFLDDEQTLWHVVNGHTDCKNNFFMDEGSVERTVTEIYEKNFSHIIGIWHTHPNGYPWPSPRDIVGWPNAALGWRYFLVARGDVTEWRLVRD